MIHSNPSGITNNCRGFDNAADPAAVSYDAVAAGKARGRDVVIVGEGRLAALYARGLVAQGVAARRAPAEAATLAGLARARSLALPPAAAGAP